MKLAVCGIQCYSGISLKAVGFLLGILVGIALLGYSVEKANADSPTVTGAGTPVTPNDAPAFVSPSPSPGGSDPIRGTQGSGSIGNSTNSNSPKVKPRQPIQPIQAVKPRAIIQPRL